MTRSPRSTRTRRIRTSRAVQQRARELRGQMTPTEKALWQRLRAGRLNGLKFRRQHPLGPFIADFYCAAHRLVIEIDGELHGTQVERDQVRTEQFKAYGYRVVRFSNIQVEGDIDAVLAEIAASCV